MSGIEEVNREYYNSTYSGKGALISYLHSLFSFDQQSKSRLNIREINRVLKDTVTGNEKVNVLDYGFGHGSLLLKLPSTVNAYGIDIADEAVIKLNRIGRMLGRQFHLSTPEEFRSRFPDSRFRIIACSHVLEHVPNDIEILKQFSEMLDDSGVLVINLPVNEVWEDPKHVRKYTLESARETLKAAGFRIERFSMQDRVTGWLQAYEVGKKNGPGLRPVFRLLRLALGIFPPLTGIAERLLLKNNPCQQMILVASRNV